MLGHCNELGVYSEMRIIEGFEAGKQMITLTAASRRECRCPGWKMGPPRGLCHKTLVSCEWLLPAWWGEVRFFMHFWDSDSRICWQFISGYERKGEVNDDAWIFLAWAARSIESPLIKTTENEVRTREKHEQFTLEMLNVRYLIDIHIQVLKR